MPAALVVDRAYVQSILPPALAWLYPYLPWMHGLEIGNLATFCSVDPPTWTVPSASDIYALITGGSVTQAATVTQFIDDITRAYLWYKTCQCNSVATPAPPTAPAAPSNLPAVNPTGIVGTPTAPCQTDTAAFFVPNSSGAYDLFAHAAASTTFYRPLPVGATSYQAFCSFGLDGTPDTSTLGSTGANVEFFDSSNTFVGQGTADHIDAGVVSRTGLAFHTDVKTIPSTATKFTFWGATGSGGSGTATVTVNWYCGTGINLGNGAVQCCTASDPVTQATLNQLLELVTLLQRQTAPFAYVTGTAHAGLMGTGTVAVQGILGVLLNVSIPARSGLEVGTPDTVFDVGWINFGTADGYTDRVFIRSDSQLVYPPVPGQYTIVGYTLDPGVTMTLTELRREP